MGYHMNMPLLQAHQRESFAKQRMRRRRRRKLTPILAAQVQAKRRLRLCQAATHLQNRVYYEEITSRLLRQILVEAKSQALHLQQRMVTERLQFGLILKLNTCQMATNTSSLI
jgi:hypothetical protein